MAPLVNSFVPDRKGQFSGTANAEVRIQGAGRTGHSLQKNLAGQFDLGATNLNFTLDNARSKLVRKLSNVLLTLPDLARNPTGAGVGKLIGAMMGGSRSTDTGEWSKQVKASPVDSLNLRGSVGNGTVHIEEALAQSPAFLARASGEMTLMPVLTNSMLRFPVELSLSRSLAEKSGLLPINTPTNAAYVKLPDFLTLEGSMGDPKSKINYLALAKLVSQSGANLTSGSGNQDLDRASGILGAVGNLLGGKASPGTNAPAEDASTNTPSPSTNKFLDLFK
jgi:hypothetical protein